METVQAINTIAQLGGTALAIAVLIYVLAFFRNEVRANKKDLTKYIDDTLQTQKDMQENYLKSLAEQRLAAQGQEEYIRGLTRDMIEVLNTNNTHLQSLIIEIESNRKDMETNLRQMIEANQKEINRKLMLIATAVGVDPKEFIKD